MKKMKGTLLAILLAGTIALPITYAQQPQIPTLQVCNPSKVEVEAAVYIDAREDSARRGIFKVSGRALFDSTTPYPAGRFIIGISMSDSIEGTVTTTSIDQITTTGKHTPVAYLSGRCDVETPEGKLAGCRYWLMIVNNRVSENNRTPDIIGFLIFSKEGKRIAYGTGPVVDGKVYVAPSSY